MLAQEHRARMACSAAAVWRAGGGARDHCEESVVVQRGRHGIQIAAGRHRKAQVACDRVQLPPRAVALEQGAAVPARPPTVEPRARNGPLGLDAPRSAAGVQEGVAGRSAVLRGARPDPKTALRAGRDPRAAPSDCRIGRCQTTVRSAPTQARTRGRDVTRRHLAAHHPKTARTRRLGDHHPIPARN